MSKANTFKHKRWELRIMCANLEKGSSYTPHITGAALSILVMGISLLAIIIAYVSFGHLGPKFSENLMQVQQATLRKEYDLPAKPVVTNDTLLLSPPSLRNITQGNHTP